MPSNPTIDDPRASLIILPRRYRSTLDYLRGELADSFSIQTFDSSISTPKLPMILCIRLPTRLSIPTEYKMAFLDQKGRIPPMELN
ncbi:hypothetical protein PGTUg99_031309 [Puccinia graminis f. sp. tritici]|uniref:Uncharacterized protein n=1 Tax=Puccinia graminis f. sp. tritici TaxID=56615 RepID=A0A5B0S4A6_PUCGR|nr:hypothetical protein PGTUg99_031309 [Puccinia graminis f. sp. tritici]